MTTLASVILQSVAIAGALSKSDSGSGSGEAGCTCDNQCGTVAGALTIKVDYGNGTAKTFADVPWFKQMNVYLAMKNLQHDNAEFTFDTTYYYPWGEFISSITGVAAGQGHFWHLAIDGVSSGCGGQTALVGDDSVVEWKITSVGDFDH